MDESHSIVTVSRVTRSDTLHCRAYCPMLRARGDVAITPAGVWCGHDATDHILDWCEIHADAERLKLLPYDYLRDEYGRLVADLADIQSGETLSAYLLSIGVAKPRPHHMLEVMGAYMSSREPDNDGG
jgi:hypothetical protein